MSLQPLSERRRRTVSAVVSTAVALVASLASLSVGVSPASANVQCTVGASYAGGAGTQINPYQIATRDELLYLTTRPADWDKYFVVTANLDFGPNNVFCNNYSQIGTTATPFTGSFNGGLKSITKIQFFSNASPVGMFGVVGTNGSISNVLLDNPLMSTTTQPIGALVGELRTGAHVTSSRTLYGTVDGNATMSALVGVSAGTIQDSYSFMTVRAGAVTAVAGGLVGYNTGTVSDSFSRSTFACMGGVNSNCFQTVGGIVGVNGASATTITRTYAEGEIPPNQVSKGGLIGNNLDSGSDVTASYFDSTRFGGLSAVGSGNAVANAGKTTAEMKTLSTYTAASFLIAQDWDATKTWGLCSSSTRPFETNGYPFLTVFYSTTPCSFGGGGGGGGFGGGQNNNQNQNNATARIVSLYWSTLDTNGGSCRVDGVTITSSVRTPFLGYRYIPSADECAKSGFAFGGWAQKSDPGTIMRFPRLIDMNDGLWRFFIVDNYDLVAVWVSPAGAAVFRS